MENGSDRTLAYKLATVIKLDELDNVAGGNQQFQINIPTVKITGGPMTPDFIGDGDNRFG